MNKDFFTECRIGIIKNIDEEITIHWNSDGVKTYNKKEIPVEILKNHQNWVIHSIFKLETEKFISAWIEPPYRTDEEVIAEDMKHPEKYSLNNLPDADWPKLKD